MFTFIGIFILGIQLGATACAISCMPIMTPILLSGTNNKKQTLEILLQYFSAKVVAYTFIAVISFFSASVIKAIMNDHENFIKIAGICIITVGITLLYKSLFAKKGGLFNILCQHRIILKLYHNSNASSSRPSKWMAS